MPAGTRHNFRNTGDDRLVLCTIYSPQQHAVDVTFTTKEETDSAEASGQDQPLEG